jgi:hypothetical protein
VPTVIHDMEIKALRATRGFDAALANDQTSRGGKIVIYHRPQPRIDYGMGGDWAYGIQGRDRDAFCIFGKFPHGDGYRIVQVAQAWGWWGERVHRVVYGLLRYYNNALLVGERQVGLPSMRRLIDEYGYRRIYFDRQMHRSGKPRTDVLGIHRVRNDITLTNFRVAVAEEKVVVNSTDLAEEIDRLQWASKTEETYAKRTPDEGLVLRVQSGGSPDLVMSAVYGYHAARCLHLFPEEKREQVGWPDVRVGGESSPDEEINLARPKRRA